MAEPDNRPGASDVPSRFHIDFAGRTLLGIYRVDRALAEGGMGSVYLAQDTNLGRRVVVKVPHVRFLGEAGFRSRFRREISELVRLEHPHVVRILAQGEEDEIPYFVLQYLGGGSLEDRLESGPEKPESALTWLMTIAQTLDFVHEHGVIHRDVKPGNILFDELGHVFLSDFGVVKALERADGTDAPNLTEAGTGIGSPFYMAPEQALGRSLSKASDQYALASTLFEALAGRPPFGRGSLVETILKKDREAPPSIRSLAPSVPEACDAAILRALSREPDARFPSCAAFADAYRQGIASASTAAQMSVGSAASARSGSRRRIATVAALAALAVLIVGAGVGAATDWYGLGKPVASPPPATGGVLVQIVKPGAEPRLLLRLASPQGAHAKAMTTMEQQMSMKFGDGEPKKSSTTLEEGVEASVAEVAADGALRIEWLFHVPRAVEKPGEPGDEVAKLSNKLSEKLGEVVGSTLTTPRGVHLEGSFRLKSHETSKNPLIGGIIAGFEETARCYLPTLPEEPVGVGAEWDVMQIIRTFGMRYQRTSTYTLVSREGDRVRLRLKESFAAPSQVFHPERGPEEMPETQIRALSGSGEQELVVDLGQPIPALLDSTGSMTFQTSAKEGGVERTVYFEKRYTIHSKRE